MAAINVTFNPHGNGFICHLKNGSIDVPNDTGGYIISTGCGAGKTESIKQIIEQKKDLGILYCVDTTREVDRLYKYLKDYSILPENEMLRIHGEKSAESELKTYRDSPEDIMSKKVILITHIRFWTDLIHLFMIYNPKQPVGFDGNFEKLMKRDDLRAYIIFDETPMFHKPFINIPKAVLGNFSKKNKGKWKCKDPVEIENTYMKFIENTQFAFSNSKHKLGRIKRDVALACIPNFWNEWISSDNPNMDISFYPTNLCQTIIKTHVLIFEGAGDLLLRNAKGYKIINLKDKYKSTVNFTNTMITMQARREKLDEPQFNNMVSSVEKILNARIGQKTLIVSWKNIGHSNENDTGKSDWCNLIDAYLMLKGFTNGIDYSITYFGANDTKSTNEFRNYTGIILLGEWNTPDSFANSVRKAFASDTTIEEYRLWYYTQLLCRIGIRNLLPGNYDIYYTDDYKESFINKLSLYLNNNTYTIPKSKSSKKGWFDVRAKEAKINIKLKVEIEILAATDIDLKEAIRAKNHHTFKIAWSELLKHCPRKEKKKRSYEPLIKSFARIGITMVIT